MPETLALELASCFAGSFVSSLVVGWSLTRNITGFGDSAGDSN